MGYTHLTLTTEQVNFLYTLLVRVEGQSFTLNELKDILAYKGAKTQKTPVFSGKIEILKGKLLCWNEVVECGEYEVFDEKGAKMAYTLLKTTRFQDIYYYLIDYSSMKMVYDIKSCFWQDKYFRKIE